MDERIISVYVDSINRSGPKTTNNRVFMVFDRYLMKNLLLATMFTALSLAAVIMLTQSLRFLELRPCHTPPKRPMTRANYPMK